MLKPRRAGFTLIELLLVLILIGVILGVSMPYFVRSIRGNRLRTAGRTLVTVSRYARSMAVLKQADIRLVFDLDSGQVDVLASGTTLPVFSRAVEGVRMQEVALEGEDPVTAGSCTVQYFRNGLARPFEVTIVDPHGSRLTVKLDAFSSATVEQHDGPAF